VDKPYEPTPSTEASAALDELRSLPSLAETKAQVQSAMEEIRAAVGTLIPSAQWKTVDEGATGNCEHPYEQSGGKREFLPNLIASNVAVSEQDWMKIADEAERIAAGLDATDVQVMRDKPGNHDVWFTGPTGLFIKVSYGGNLVVAGYTGCRL
jgi:hypothetical protein